MSHLARERRAIRAGGTGDPVTLSRSTKNGHEIFNALVFRRHNHAQPATTIDYLNPQLPEGLAHVNIPLVVANSDNLRGFGELITSNPEQFPIEIVRWPAQGWPCRPGFGQ